MSTIVRDDGRLILLCVLHLIRNESRGCKIRPPSSRICFLAIKFVACWQLQTTFVEYSDRIFPFHSGSSPITWSCDTVYVCTYFPPYYRNENRCAPSGNRPQKNPPQVRQPPKIRPRELARPMQRSVSEIEILVRRQVHRRRPWPLILRHQCHKSSGVLPRNSR